MKTYRVICFFAFLLCSCNVFSGRSSEALSLLTPYVTQTAPVPPTATVTETPQATPTPTLTPTPFTHVLAANETIYSLAYTYNLAVNDILAVNPQITPKALSVGTEIKIPYIGTPQAEKSTVESVISAPLALTVSLAKCTGTTEGGLWCVAQVENPLGQSANGITLTFTLKDGDGQTVDEQTVPALLNLLAPGDKLPVNAYFGSTIPSGYQVQVALKTALPVEEGGALSTPVEIKVNSIDPHGREATVSAVIPVQKADSGVESVWVALIAYDQSGSIVGLRRLEYPAVTQGDEGHAIKVSVYSGSSDIAKVEVLGEAQLKKK